MDANDIFKKLSSGARFKKKPLVKNIINSKAVKIKEEIGTKEPASSRKTRKKNSLPLIDRDELATVFDSFLDTRSSVKAKRQERNIIEQNKEAVAQIRNKFRISALGKAIPDPITDFEELSTKYNLLPGLVKDVNCCGYETPTPIQMQVMPLMLQGRQILACAPTGSGKTAAFLVPIIQHLKSPRPGGFRALIVCPTRELAAQTYRYCELLSVSTNLRSLLVSKISPTEGRLNIKSDILITTPNSLVYMLKQEPPLLSLKKVEWMVVDECDKLFEAGVRGFRDQLAVIYTSCDSGTVKRAMFSATQSPDLTRWCRRNLKGLVSVNVGIRGSASSDVEQRLVFVGSETGKLLAFRNLVTTGLTPPVLVFVQSKDRAQELFNELIYDGINVDVIHSDRTLVQRENVIRSFREGSIWVLICTELMGRGIDFKGVNLVVNYDFPPSTVAYIHRVGRTGRAGRKGQAVTFFTMDDTTNLRSIARIVKESGGEVPDYVLSLKKATKNEKFQLKRRAPEREPITTTPVYEEILQRRKQNAIKRTKKRKAQQGNLAASQKM